MLTKQFDYKQQDAVSWCLQTFKNIRSKVKVTVTEQENVVQLITGEERAL